MAVNLVEHSSLLLGQSQVVIQLTGIFQRIDLCLAIGAQRMAHTQLHQRIHRNDAIAEIAFCRRTGADDGMRLRKCGYLMRIEMNRMHRYEIPPQQAFSCEQLYWRAPILLLARCVLGDLFCYMHMDR